MNRQMSRNGWGLRSGAVRWESYNKKAMDIAHETGFLIGSDLNKGLHEFDPYQMLRKSGFLDDSLTAIRLVIEESMHHEFVQYPKRNT